MKKYLPYLLAGLLVVLLTFGLSMLAVSCSNAQQQNTPVYQNDNNYEDSSYEDDDDEIDIDIHKPKTKTYKHDSYKSRSYSKRK